MVVIKHSDNMFWGVTIDAGKRYSQVVKQAFHVSMAALEVQANKPSENVQVLLQHESTEYLLCTLNGRLLQQPLDLNFATGEQVSFCLNGSGVIHLTGFLIPDEEPDFDESFSESEDDEAPSLVDASGDGQNKAGKRKAVASSKATKKIKLSESIEVEDDDDSEEEEGFSDDFDDEFDDEDDIEEDEATSEKKGKSKTQANAETPVPQKNKQGGKTPKQDGKTPATPKQAATTPKQGEKTPAAQTASKHDGKVKKGGQFENHTDKPVTQDSQQSTQPSEPAKQQDKATVVPSASGSEESAKKKKKKKKKKKNKEGDASQNESTASTPATTPKPELTPKKRVVAGGTIVEDLKVGHGPEAKPGKMASVYYVGTLAKTSKRFDACTEGKPFRFRLNQGEVIKGWDNGVLGMKVGGKRKITVPANQGYGNVKQGPIPPNSALVFEVELKAVS